MELLLRLATEMPDLHIERGLLHAAMRGDLEMVRYLHARGRSDRGDARTFFLLHRSGMMNVLAYLVEHDLVDVDAHIAWFAVMTMNRDVETRDFVQRFASRFQAVFESVVSSLIAVGECAQACKLIHQGIFDMNITISIDIAASQGLLDCVALLHQRGIATATTEAMNSAAESGHWHVVTFLHDHRTEGCTTRTMDAAAVLGLPSFFARTERKAARHVLWTKLQS